MARALIFAMALLAAASTSSRAADPEGYYTIQGVGIETCETWLGERQSDGPTAWFHQQWVLGYLTAFNRWVHNDSDVANKLASDKLFTWLDEYCHRNVQHSLSIATEAMVWTLRDR